MIGELTGLIAVLVIFGLPGLYFFGKTEIGKAIVHRMRYGAEGADPALLAEVDELRARLAEVEDRLDFAERQLVSGPADRSNVPSPKA